MLILEAVGIVETIGIVFSLLGLAGVAFGQLWLIILALRTGILWLLGCLFVPFVMLFFVVTHWEEAQMPAILCVVGYVFLGVAHLYLNGMGAA
jgi:hypothetical protein